MNKNFEAFECPPLPPESQAEIDNLMERRRMLLETNCYSYEIGDLALAAEKIDRTWRESCEKEWLERIQKGNAPSVAPQSKTTSPPTKPPGESVPTAAASAQIGPALFEYQSLKERETQGALAPGAAMTYWREHRSQIESEAALLRKKSPDADTTGSFDHNCGQPIQGQGAQAANEMALVSEYLSLKDREKNGEVPASTALRFWRANKTAMRCEKLRAEQPETHIARSSLKEKFA